MAAPHRVASIQRAVTSSSNPLNSASSLIPLANAPIMNTVATVQCPGAFGTSLRQSIRSVKLSSCYAFLLHRRIAMSDSDLLPSPLYKINENQLALEAAILELSNWVEQRGSAEVADNIRGALAAIDRIEEFIKMALAVLMTPE